MDNPKLLLEHTKDLTILYAEDDLPLQASTNEMWSMFFKKVDLANDGRDAWELYKNNDYDIVITDISMPHMSGIELIEHVLELKQDQSIIVLSAHSDSEYLLAMIKLGITHFIAKPFNLKQLFKMLFDVSSALTDKRNLFFYHEHIEALSLELEKKNHELQKALNKQKSQESDPKATKTISSIPDERLNDIRFNQSDKINSRAFCESLDEGTMNKIDLFLEDIDGLVMYLYDLEENDASKYEESRTHIIELFNDVYNIIDLMAVFPIITRSFISLVDFLTSLEFEGMDGDKRKIIAQSLRGLSDDFEAWVAVVFVDRTTEDIHYFDASFASNCLAIEAIFNEEDTSSEDDLEFF